MDEIYGYDDAYGSRTITWVQTDPRNITMILSLLLAGAMVLNIFLTVFGQGTLFPLDSFDFWFLCSLAFGFSLFRPGWSFLILISLLPFETLNLAPESLGVAMRPYQLLVVAIFVALVIRRSVGRLGFPISFRWFDVLPVVFALGGLVSALMAEHPAIALKQAVVVGSFVIVYLLSRQFLSQKEDARRIVPFLLLSGIVSGVYAVIQNIRFSYGLDSFEAMPGRPNAFFPEADWLGMYLIFLGSLAFAGIYSWWGGGTRNRSASKSLGSQLLQSEIVLPEGIQKSVSLIGHVIDYLMMSRLMLWFRRFGPLFFFLFTFFVSIVVLILTVARSAWIGMASATFAGFGAFLFLKRKERFVWRSIAAFGGMIAVSIFLSVAAVLIFHLTSFELSHRTASVGSGWQNITVSCDRPTELPERINSMGELAVYSCRFIRLEDIEAERLVGHSVQQVLRPDPSIAARREIFSVVAEQIREHPILGIGWGSIGDVLGTDDRGARLNASNAFLETWLGGGVLSLFSLLVFWLLIPAFAMGRLLASEKYTKEEQSIALFFLVSWVGFSCFNLFNSGLFLGFVWVWLGGIGLIAPTKK